MKEVPTTGSSTPDTPDTISTLQLARRRLIAGAAASTAIGFSGPWTAHRAWAQARTKNPLVIGLTTDDTGQYAASGQDEQRGILMAIREANERGGVLGRRIETVHYDTGGNPATATAVAERMLKEHEVAFMIGAAHSKLESYDDTPSYEV
jgi:branched-chain amino acid transport system substrate-binding protein